MLGIFGSYGEDLWCTLLIYLEEEGDEVFINIDFGHIGAPKGYIVYHKGKRGSVASDRAVEAKSNVENIFYRDTLYLREVYIVIIPRFVFDVLYQEELGDVQVLRVDSPLFLLDDKDAELLLAVFSGQFVA